MIQLKRKHVGNVLAASLAALLAGLAPGAARAATFTVTKTNDTNDGTCDADCSLREAILAANASAGADIISLPAGLYILTINGSKENAAATGDLDITDDVTLLGAGAGVSLINASGLAAADRDRVFHVLAGSLVEIEGVTITGGGPPDGTLVQDKNGGGIFNAGTLTVSDSTISSNSATNAGGGIANDTGATLTVENSTLSNNSADGGGGVSNFGGDVLISDSTLSFNSVLFDGGAISNNAAGVPGVGGTMTVTNTTFSNNMSARDGGAIWNGSDPSAITVTNSDFTDNTSDRSGGAIENGGTMNMTGGTLAGNTAVSQGGAVRNSGTLTITATTFSGNSGFWGGAIHNDNSRSLNIDSSTFSDNSATSRFGGGVSNDGTVTVTASTFVNNVSNARSDSLGGAIYVGTSGTATLVNSTIHNNTSVSGGGIFSFGVLTVRSSTVALNSSTSSVGGIAISFSLGTANIGNSIIAQNVGGDCGGPITSDGYNIEGTTSCGFTATGDQQSTDPMLGALVDNGGPTQTRALSAASPAIDAGDPSGCTDGDGAPLLLDQRGFVRKVDGDGDFSAICDVGAYEFGSELGGPCGLFNSLVLMDQTIDTTAVLEACETIMVGPNFQILAPGDVTFRAGLMVIFDNGFSVESGATMSVWIDPLLSSN